VRLEKSKYLSNIISSNSHKPSVLFSTINSVLNTPQATCLEPCAELCEQFLNFFIDKIDELRSNIVSPLTFQPIVIECSAALNQFVPVSLTSLREIFVKMKLSTCCTDIVPPRLLKDSFEAISSSVLAIINSSLATGIVPKSFKQAVVEPVIKKSSLDPSLLANFRPISKLSFLSKLLEKVVFEQLNAFLSLNGIHEVFQSGFKSLHSTETALLRVSNDLLLTTDSGNCAIFIIIGSFSCI